MSEQSQGPGWWQASDGKWYPPEQHPDHQAPAEPPVTQTLPPTTALPPVAPLSPPGPPAGPPPATAPVGAVPPATPPRGNGRWIALGVLAAVVVGLVAFLLARGSGGGNKTAATSTEQSTSSKSTSSSSKSSSSKSSSSSSSTSSTLGPGVEENLRRGLLSASDLGAGFADKPFTPTIPQQSNCGNQPADVKFPPALNIGAEMVNASSGAILIEQLEAYTSETTTSQAFAASKVDFNCTQGTVDDGSQITFGARQDVSAQLKGRESYEQSFAFGNTQGVLVVVHLNKSVLTFQFFAPAGASTAALPDPLTVVEQGIEKLQS